MTAPGISKNAARRARRYGPDPAAVGGLGERAAWRELAEGSGVLRIAGLGQVVRAAGGTAAGARRACRAAGLAWRAGVRVSENCECRAANLRTNASRAENRICGNIGENDKRTAGWQVGTVNAR
jgi:hypothetical protein